MLRQITDDALRDALEARDTHTLSLAGMNQAILGLTEEDEPRLVYSRDAIVALLVESGMTYSGATEYLEFNIIGAYVGHQTPLIIDSLEDTC